MIKNKDLEKRVKQKRNLFMGKLKGFDLSKEILLEIELLADSMEYANCKGEVEIANHYKDQIKKTILNNR